MLAPKSPRTIRKRVCGRASGCARGVGAPSTLSLMWTASGRWQVRFLQRDLKAATFVDVICANWEPFAHSREGSSEPVRSCPYNAGAS